MLKRIAVMTFSVILLAAGSLHAQVATVGQVPTVCQALPLLLYQAGSALYIAGPGNTCVELNAVFMKCTTLAGVSTSS